MFKTKTTKSALVTSVLSLFICFAMLLGTTFAWFTDSVTSANNIIKSGTLNVEMYYADGKLDVPADSSTDWKNAQGVAIYTANQIWEPGYTDAKHIKVSNEGSLALKYQLAIIPTGEVSELAKVIDVYYIEGATKIATRADLANYSPIGTLADLISNGIKQGTLKAEEDYTATLVLKMQEDAGNEYQNKSIGDAFTIQLLATQYTEESDSFDNYYDGATDWYGGVDTSWYDSTKDEFVIGSPEQLAGLAAIVNGTAETSTVSLSTTSTNTIQDDFAGKTITLTSDINLNGINWTPIGNATFDRAGDGAYEVKAAFKGTFDGQNHKIFNLTINNPEVNCVALFGVIDNATVKNVKVENVDVTADGTAAAIVGYCVKSSTIENCHVSGDISIVADWAYVGGIAAYGYANISKCSVIATGTGVITSENRNAVGGIMGWNYGSTVTDCEVKNLALTAWSGVAGVEGYVPGQHTVSGCTVENVTLTKTRADGVPAVGLLVGSWSYAAKTTITLSNNSVKTATMNGTHVPYAAYNALYGASYSGTTDTNFTSLESNTTENITNNMIEVKKIENVEGLKSALGESGSYVLMSDLAPTEIITVPSGVEVVLYMNGKTIAGTDNTSKNFSIIDNRGTLTILGDGKITLTATVNSGWNRYSAVIANNPGGKLTIEGGILEHLGGTDMAYGIDNLTNGKGTYAETIINGGTVKSPYRAIRQFLNGVEAQNILTVNGGTIEGANKSIWMQDPSKNANTGRLTVTENAVLKGDVYLFVTAGSAEWPVEASIATKALYGESTVITGNVPAGYVVINDGTKWFVKSGEVVNDLSGLTGNSDVYLPAGNYTLLGATNSNVTISGTKDTVISVSTPAFHGSDVTLNGVTIQAPGGYVGIQHVNTVTYNDVTVNGSMKLYGEKVVFNNCTFNLNGDYIWTYGAAEVEFNNCTFNTTGKAILIYNEGDDASKVTVKGCTFNATEGAKAGAIANQNCAAIEIDNFQNNGKPGTGHTLITEGNTYSSNFSGEWRIKNYQTGDAVTVNGVEYTQIAIDGKLMTIDASKNVTVIG